MNITQEQIEKFYSKIEKLAKEEFGTFDSGSCPVKMIVVDRTKFMPPTYSFHVPEIKNYTVAECKIAEKCSRVNMMAALQQYEMICKLLEDAEQKEENNEST